MSCYYEKQSLNILEDEFTTLQTRRESVVENLLNYQFTNARAEEYARHGVGRRISTVARCIRNVFELLPPNLETIPTIDETYDALIQLQTHIINVFGCVDNLAWMWVLETDLKAPDGTNLDRKEIGLRKRHKIVLGSLSKEVQAFLASIKKWFTYLEDYRHALAHRIPLYVPPFEIDPKNEPRIQELSRLLKMEAIKEGSRAKYQQLEKELDSLKFFRPFIMHSWSEARPMAFHQQVLTDFKTIDVLTTKMIGEMISRRS
jgi:hypothetical protein